MPFLALQELTADELTAHIGMVARKSSDETVNNSATLQNDDALVLSVPAISAVYLFDASFRYSTNSTANLKWAFTIPAGATLVYCALHIPAGGSSMTFTELINTAVGTADDGLGYIQLQGTFQTTGTGGTLQLQWAQNTANASDTKIRDTSYMVLRKFA